MKIAMINLITRTPTRRNVPEIISNRDSMIVKFCQDLAAQGCDVELLVSDFYRAKKEEDLGLRTIFLRSFFKRLPEQPFVPGVFLKVLAGKYSSVILSEAFQWSTVFACLAWLFSVRKPKLIVWQELAIHQKPFKQIPSKVFHCIVLRYFLDCAVTAYIPRSEAARQFLIRQGISEHKIRTVISHGADHRMFFPAPCDHPRGYVFCPARLLMHEKGLDVLIKAFGRVVSEVPDAKLIIQGAGPDEAQVWTMIQAHKLTDNVALQTAHVDHAAMRGLYQNALVTVIASRRDNVILSSMESALCGTPVIMSDAIDNSSVFADGLGGAVFPCCDDQALADKIIEYFINTDFSVSMRSAVLVKSAELSNEAMARKMHSEIYCLSTQG